MLENVVGRFQGRELVNKDELAKSEVGVEVRSENLLGLYAFPDSRSASNFMQQAAEEFVIETGEVAMARVFEVRPWWKFW